MKKPDNLFKKDNNFLRHMMEILLNNLHGKPTFYLCNQLVDILYENDCANDEVTVNEWIEDWYLYFYKKFPWCEEKRYEIGLFGSRNIAENIEKRKEFVKLIINELK